MSEKTWSEEHEDWVIRNVIRRPDGRLLHYICWLDSGGFAAGREGGLKRPDDEDGAAAEQHVTVKQERSDEEHGHKRIKLENK